MARAEKFITEFASKGRHHFTTEVFRSAYGASEAAAKMALNRLEARGVIANPARGHWVIVPPEYRRLGCLPPEQFIPAMMEAEQQPYYVALLSAAQIHGAANQRPQIFQVMTARSRRALRCGSVRVSFIAHRGIKDAATVSQNTPSGVLVLSSVETTMLDLVGYHHRAGGLDNVATVIAELAELANPELLVEAASRAPMPWAQRLGYVLELVGADAVATHLKKFVHRNAKKLTLLMPSVDAEAKAQSAEWRLVVNSRIEVDG